MSIQHRGTAQPLQQRYEEHYDPKSGYTREIEFRGLGPIQMRQLAYRYARAGCGYSYTDEFGVSSLRAIDTTGEVTIDTWEIGLNKLSPSSLQNPYNILNIAADDLIVIGLVQSGETSYEEAESALAGHAAALRLLDRMQLGSDSYYRSGYVLRHTTNVSNRWRLNVADENVDCIYTTAQLLSEAQNSNSWIFPLPGRLSYKINFLPFPAFQSNYLWGWLKSGSPESTAANNRVDIVTEYEQGHWSTDEYATV